ncbi:MAG: class I SAM-dependent methyltransferase [Bacilli bacterium]|nr:class I SAM-dependent methyltransferase [Bacilli bacterium]MBN2877439.1 class I SAM-dependent methyltransferase [Bacilli bacterium]
MERLQTFLKQIPNAKILDVGTGVGNFIGLIDYLHKDYEKIVGIDIMDRMVSLASKNFEDNEKVKIVKRDILDTGFPSAHFDIVCLSNSLHHLADVDGTFEAMEELVKPGGYLLFNEMRSDELNEEQISHRLIHHFSAKLDRELGMVHDDTFTKQEIIDQIKTHSNCEIIDYWEMEVPVSKPSKEEIEQMTKTVDALLNRIQNEEIIARYKAEAEAIKEYIRLHGIQACTQILVVARKKS